MLKFFAFIWFFGTLFLPDIIGAILLIIIICLIRKKTIEKDQKLKILVCAIIIILVSRNLGYSVMNYLSAKPDKVYTEMQEIDESKKLIGLSKDEVVRLLGEPLNSSTDDMYIYDAGKITNYFFFGERKFYDLFVRFDENNKVKSTSIDFQRGG